ncbi:MAG: O-antigen ligase family protein [Deferrisomatales bacterium]|nr:O-antigen ligase family protein [Deferrisomatales bacterium]
MRKRLTANNFLESAMGVMVAGFVISGRWDLARLFEWDGRDFLAEPRLWVVGLSAVLAMALLSASAAQTTLLKVPAAALLLVVFLAFVIASSLWSSADYTVGDKLYDVVLLLLFSLFLIITLGMSKEFYILDAFWITLFIGTAMLALFGVYQASGPEGERISVLGGGPIVFGRLMGLCLLGSLRIWRRGVPVSVILPLVAVSSLLVVSSGSRGALVSVVCAVAVFFVLERVPFWKVAIVGLAGAVTSAAIVFWTPFGESVASMYGRRIVELTIEEQYTSGRTEIYRAALKLGSENPFVGAGLGGFASTGLHVYPHNLFLEVFSETGMAGLGLIAAALGLAGAQMIRSRRRVDAATVAALVLALMSSQFSGDLFDSRSAFIFLLFCTFRPRAFGGAPILPGGSIPFPSPGLPDIAGIPGSERNRHGPGSMGAVPVALRASPDRPPAMVVVPRPLAPPFREGS